MHPRCCRACMLVTPVETQAPVDNRRTFRSVETRATEKVLMPVSSEQTPRSEQYHEFKHVETLHLGKGAFFTLTLPFPCSEDPVQFCNTVSSPHFALA
jgi:hypothetical protein